MGVIQFFQAPGNSQSVNPYSYIMNNPLAGVDPSGYCSTKDTAAECGDTLASGETSEITNADGDVVGHVGKDADGNLHFTNNGSEKGKDAIQSVVNGSESAHFTFEASSIGGQSSRGNVNSVAEQQSLGTEGFDGEENPFTETNLEGLAQPASKDAGLQGEQDSAQKGRFTEEQLKYFKSIGFDPNGESLGGVLSIDRVVFCSSDPGLCATGNEAANMADESIRQYYWTATTGGGNEVDAYRHAFASFALAQRVGYDRAIRITDAYEVLNFENGGKVGSSMMDLRNNRIGAYLGIVTPGGDEKTIRLTIQAAIRDGSIKTEPY